MQGEIIFCYHNQDVCIIRVAHVMIKIDNFGKVWGKRFLKLFDQLKIIIINYLKCKISMHLKMLKM